MQISKINSTANIYASKAVSMKARMSSQAVLKDFNKFLKSNGAMLKADLNPDGKGNYQTTVVLVKPDVYGYKIVPVTDEDNGNIIGIGRNVNDAVLDMIKINRNKDAYCQQREGQASFIFKMPNYMI